MAYDLDRHVTEFRINGFTVFQNLIPHEKIDQMLAA